MLSIRGCSYRFPGADRWAFRGIDFEIAPGEIVVLRGRNGSGKSTLLKVVCGILEPTEGRINASRDVRPIYMDQAADEMLALDLTVLEQLSAFHTIPSPSVVQMSDRLRKFGVDLDARLNEFVGHLSGGQRQIIALLATVEGGANLLCLDEFLSALDARSAEVATNLIEQFVANERVSVIAVSHSPLNLRPSREVDLDRAKVQVEVP